MPTTTDDAIDGIMPTGPLKTGYVGYRDFFPDIPAFGTEYDVDRMSTVFDPSGSFQSDRDIVNMLAAAYPDESAEQIADRLQSLTANTAMARQFGDAAPDPYSQLAPTPTTPAPADDTNILDTIKSIPGAAVDAAKSAADTLLNQIKEFLPFYDQSQVVLNPRTGQATVVFGTPPSGSPVVQAGNLPKSNTNVGITTGVPILDQAINSVLNKPGGLESGSIRDEVIKIISEQAGLDPATTASILGKDFETIFSDANTKAATTAARLGVDLTGEKKDDVVRDTGTDVVRDTGTNVASDTGTSTSDSVDTVLSGGSLTPADLGETPYTVEGTPGTVETGGGGTTATPAAPAPSQGMRTERTKKAGLADIEDVFNIEDMSLANVLSLLAGEGDNTQRAPYYGGGSVNRADSVDEIIRLLRG